MSRNRVALGAIAVTIAGFAGCAKPQDSTGPSSGGGPGGKSTVTIRGSDTMLQLAQAWAEEFGRAHPEVNLNVNGGGSGTGLKALVNRTTDIANASRAIEVKEREALARAGAEPREYVVAQDALSVIVHPSNPVGELTMAQLKDIYTGKVTNWKQVGGPDLKISLNSRDSSSGTYKFFQEHVLDKEPYANEAQLQPSTNGIVQNVGQDRGGIGYVGLGYVNETVKAIRVKKDGGSPAIAANVEDVLNKTYPLSRPLYMYTAGEPTPGSKTFIDWVLSEAGQAVVKKLDFVPVK